ncbi:MAG: type II secretion system protein [Gallionellaceae bacterium]|jgi:MSHA biogenesis protein MshO
MKMRKLIQAGFTLVEMIIVMVITGIVGGMVAVFLTAPIQQYMDIARRTELADSVDTALFRLIRDIRIAIPNSISAPTGSYVEFIPGKDGGRYRAHAPGAGGCGAAGDALSFSPDVAAGDTCFEVAGRAIPLASGDYLVVGSTQSDASLPYLTTASGVLRSITASAVTGTIHSITMAGAALLPASAKLDSQRFQIVDGAQQAVTYACVPLPCGLNASGNGSCTLTRYWNYGFSHPLPPITTGQSAVLADNVSACNFAYDVVNQRSALLGITLQLTQANETVSLYQEVHVGNAP